MTKLFQEILLLAAQYAICLLTLAQLLIFVALGSLHREKRDSLPRYIAGVLQLFVIDGIAWYSALWGFIAFLATYTLSFVWHFKSFDKKLEQLGAENNNASVSEDGDETGDAGADDDINDLNKY